MGRWLQLTVLVICLSTLHVQPGAGVGRLQLPLGRSSVWRAGLDTPRNYDDHMLDCGGLEYKKKHGNQCGLCGDPIYQVRENEDGGRYANGVITGQYAPGQRTQFKVLMNSNHGGYMKFSLCPESTVTQACFDKHPIPLADGTGNRFPVPTGQLGVFSVDLVIPPVTCQRCVMQWTYTGDDAWGQDQTGGVCEGCGPQFELRNCADVSVTQSGGFDTVPVLPAIRTYNTAGHGGLNPEGTYYFDSSIRSDVKTNPDRGRSPYAPPPRADLSDPWTNPRRTPSRTDQSLTRNRPDPWINPRAPTLHRSPPRITSIRLQQSRSRSPFTPPTQDFDNTNRQSVINNAPQQTRLNNRESVPDPWIVSKRPTVNQSQRRNNPNPFSPPQSQERSTRPRQPSSGQSPARNNIPYAPPQSLRNNSPDPWISPQRSTDSQGVGRNRFVRPQTKRGDNADPWTNPQSARQDAQPQLACVAIGTKAGMEGMDEWCTDNCNSDFCPEVYCSCH